MLVLMERASAEGMPAQSRANPVVSPKKAKKPIKGKGAGRLRRGSMMAPENASFTMRAAQNSGTASPNENSDELEDAHDTSNDRNRTPTEALNLANATLIHSHSKPAPLPPALLLAAGSDDDETEEFAAEVLRKEHAGSSSADVLALMRAAQSSEQDGSDDGEDEETEEAAAGVLRKGHAGSSSADVLALMRTARSSEPNMGDEDDEDAHTPGKQPQLSERMGTSALPDFFDIPSTAGKQPQLTKRSGGLDLPDFFVMPDTSTLSKAAAERKNPEPAPLNPYLEKRKTKVHLLSPHDLMLNRGMQMMNSTWENWESSRATVSKDGIFGAVLKGYECPVANFLSCKAGASNAAREIDDGCNTDAGQETHIVPHDEAAGQLQWERVLAKRAKKQAGPTGSSSALQLDRAKECERLRRARDYEETRAWEEFLERELLRRRQQALVTGVNQAVAFKKPPGRAASSIGIEDMKPGEDKQPNVPTCVLAGTDLFHLSLCTSAAFSSLIRFMNPSCPTGSSRIRWHSSPHHQAASLVLT